MLRDNSDDVVEMLNSNDQDSPDCKMNCKRKKKISDFHSTWWVKDPALLIHFTNTLNHRTEIKKSEFQTKLKGKSYTFWQTFVFRRFLRKLYRFTKGCGKENQRANIDRFKITMMEKIERTDWQKEPGVCGELEENGYFAHLFPLYSKYHTVVFHLKESKDIGDYVYDIIIHLAVEFREDPR